MQNRAKVDVCLISYLSGSGSLGNYGCPLLLLLLLAWHTEEKEATAVLTVLNLIHLQVGRPCGEQFVISSCMK